MPGEPPGSSDPLDPAGLVGRAAEAAAIRRMLDGAPLVTVTGLPGVGKTAVPQDAGPGDQREPLRVPGETTVAVRPLRLADAVELFGRRAAQAGTQIRPVRLFSTFIRSSMRQSSLYVVDPGYAVD